MAGSQSRSRFGIVGKVIGGVWGVIKGIQSIILTLIFFTLLFIVLAVIGANKPPKVPVGSALVVAPYGLLVEQLTEVNGFSGLLTGGGSSGEALVSDVVAAIDRAADDERITTLVLRLDSMAIPMAYASKSYQVAGAVDRFKASGKSVIALGNYYSQANYLIASHADEIWLHPYGGVVFNGYERSGTYFKSLLDNLKVTMHIYKVGEYKSALEPFVRNDMSEADKVANLGLLDDMWAEYTAHVEAARGLEPGTIQYIADSYGAVLREAGGDSALAVKNVGIVDKLMAGDEWRAALVTKVGPDSQSKSFKQIDMYDYLAATTAEGARTGGRGDIAVIVAKGSIVDGEAPRGTIGGDTVARLIRKARDAGRTKAIVLRVDSSGGSLFASEVIRRELVAAKEAGIPVVASMGSLAASGGYWISSPADEIWAEPTTITGSIGVFAFFPTFENAADWAGISGDGVGTTALAGAGDPFRPLDPALNDIMQQGVEDAYNKFVGLVATSRELSEEHVRTIAEGRVWSGRDALEHGLVDSIGGLEEAIAAAAKLAGMETYNVDFLEKEISPFDQFFQELQNSVQVSLGLKEEAASRPSTGMQLLQGIARDLAPLTEMNDPNHVYLICESCEVH